jgi:hypothetical protein
MAALWSVVGFFAPLLVLIPLFVARWAVAQFAEQQKAYEATVGALCQAVETKDFYTRGHSDRVSRGSVMIAREIGMRGERVEAIRYAGMLHDVGKLGVPTKVLQKTGKLTEEEYAAIQLHPMRGSTSCGRSASWTRRWPGSCTTTSASTAAATRWGLAGDEIPEFARVLAVADAFDSMTSTRSYRGARPVAEAIEELRKWSGTQFDPAFVDAFVAALKREGWQRPEPPVIAADDLATVTAQDHDDPGAPAPRHRQPVGGTDERPSGAHPGPLLPRDAQVSLARTGFRPAAAGGGRGGVAGRRGGPDGGRRPEGSPDRDRVRRADRVRRGPPAQPAGRPGDRPDRVRRRARLRPAHQGRHALRPLQRRAGGDRRHHRHDHRRAAAPGRRAVPPASAAWPRGCSASPASPTSSGRWPRTAPWKGTGAWPSR